MHARSINRAILICLCLLGTLSSTAMAQEWSTSTTSTPFISMDVGIEISGLEKAAEQAAEGLTLIGESLNKLANNHELTPEQHRQLQRALSRVEDLGENLSHTVKQLPATVERGFTPVVDATERLSAEVKQILVIACVALVAIILAALAAVYYFVLAPATRSIIDTVELLNKLATTLETTATIVEKSSHQAQGVLQELHQLQQQLQTRDTQATADKQADNNGTGTKPQPQSD